MANVKGVVTDKKGHPLRGVTVTVFRRDLRVETVLGSSPTDEAGKYAIEYRIPPNTKGKLNLMLKVLGGREELLHQTDTMFEVPVMLTLDIRLEQVFPDLPEFEWMLQSLRPLLGRRLKAEHLEQDARHDDIRFLAGKTGIEAEKIIRFSQAHRLNAAGRIDTGFWFALLTLPFYRTSGFESLKAQFEHILSVLPKLDGTAVLKGLNSAFAGNVIRDPGERKIKSWLKAFERFAAQQVLNVNETDDAAFTKHALLDAGIRETKKQAEFARLMNKHRRFAPALLKELKAHREFTAAQINDLHTSFELSQITAGNFSVVKTIKSRFRVRRPGDIRALARKSETEWVELMEQHAAENAVKPSFGFDVPAGREARYGRMYGGFTARRFKEVFPTAAFAGGLERAMEAGETPALKHAGKLDRFLKANPELELHAVSIHKLAETDPAVRDDEAFQLELKAVQRVFKTAPDFEAVNTLLSDDLHSAQKIYRMGETEFVRTYKDRKGFTAENARLTWNKAADTHAAALSLVSELKAVENAGAVAALNSGNEAVEGFPNWKNLFKTGDLCECEHCRSVYSPAAYYADLLMFLRDRNAKNPAFSLKDILFKRRPDLGYIELNCENALTEIPYIDVVNEVLEDATAGGMNDVELTGLTAINADPVQAKTDVAAAFAAVGIDLGTDFSLSQIGASDEWVVHADAGVYLLKKKATPNYFAVTLRNTKAGRDELRANPQYVNPMAYDKLKTAVYPRNLPFDLFNAEIRAAFGKVGLKRWELMEVFKGPNPPNNPSDGDIAAEYFGIARDPSNPVDEKRLIVDADIAGQHQYWGETDNNAMLDTVKNVDVFLSRTGLDYHQMLTLLDLGFINPDGDIGIVHLDAGCDTDQKEIQILDAPKLDRIHRFLRLWRKTGWEMWELDRLIRQPGVGVGALDEPLLVNLMYFSRLKNKLGKITIEELCAFFGTLNTETRFTQLHKEREDALYQQLFLNKKYINPLDPAFEVVKVDAPNSAEIITDHLSVVTAAMRVREPDLDVFRALTKASDGTPYIADELTLINLSFLYRHARLAKLLKFKAREWAVLLKLRNHDLFAFSDPKAACDFVDAVGYLKDSGFGLDETDYILTASPDAKSAVKEPEAAGFLNGLREALQAIGAAYDPVQYDFLQAAPAENVEALSGLLGELLQTLNFDDAAVNDFLAIFESDADPLPDPFPAEVEWLTASDVTFPLDETTLAANLAAACNKALEYLERSTTENETVRQLSTQLELPAAVTRILATQFQLFPPDTILDHFAGAFAGSTDAIDYAGFKETFDSYYWLHRVSLMLNRWKFREEDLEWWLNHTGALQVLDFSTLPLDGGGPAASLETFIRGAGLIWFRDRLKEEKITFFEVLGKLAAGDTADTAAFAADAELLNDWNAPDVQGWLDGIGAALNDYLLSENWFRLTAAMKFTDKLYAGAAEAAAFAGPAVTESDSRNLKQLFRSRFGPDTWFTISTEIQDVLRERKRDALSAWLLTQTKPADAPSGKWENSADLYSYYLLDTEMSSCMLTSRLVQASGSVQLFVQRCFMGLEPEIAVKADGDDGDSAWRWWKWMKKYRVWEANRKVFLYPENWIEPELRRDKSSFFKDLENQLLQGEVNQQTVEAAYLSYLEKLNGVAQLEIAGFYHEDDADRTIIHVFGRTPVAEPHVYYYRRFDYRRWTPWELVDAEISGDYLIPAVVNKRLFLFWPVFSEVPDEASNNDVDIPFEGAADSTLPKTNKRLRMQMAVSELRNGKWTPKKVSVDAYETVPYTGEIVKKHYKFFPVDRSGVDDRFGIKFDGYSMGEDGYAKASLHGSFEIFGCKGIPEKAWLPGSFRQAAVPDQSDLEYLDYVELTERDDGSEDDLSLRQEGVQYLIPVLNKTPGHFNVAMPWHLSYLDKFFLDIPRALYKLFDGIQFSGIWLPFFYADRHKTFFVLPAAVTGDREQKVRHYYPAVKEVFKELAAAIEGAVRQALEDFDPGALSAADRQALENLLAGNFGETPPLSDERIIELTIQYFIQYYNFLLGMLAMQTYGRRRFHFKNYYHPFVCDFSKMVYNPLQGIPALMSRETQLKAAAFDFSDYYQPSPWVMNLVETDYYPREVVDFSPDGAYSPYNWELFYHVPLMIADRLSRNQRFEEAMEWYHFIFNPIGVEGKLPNGTLAGAPQKYWITKPFFLTTDEAYKQQRIDSILRMLAGDETVDGFTDQLKLDLEAQVLDWRDNPFEPHRIAQYRTVAYQKTVVMKYIDNLLAWGDYLFRRDSMESINEATQLYVIAAELLGPRPRSIPPRARPPVETFNELESDLDDFSNALVEVENVIPVMPGNRTDGDAAPLPMLYFCIPQNEKLLGYWDTVADRLYKIRHCMNIEGVVRKLSLFEPPIDPGALVKAVAGGMDISAALSDFNTPLPRYRFSILLQKANELCADVKALGGALLAALEKQDGEEMSLLRQGHEMKMLEAVRAVKELQLQEAEEGLEGLKRSKATIEVRRDFYRDIEKINAQEQLNIDKLGEAHDYQEAAQGLTLAASIISYLPDIDLGASGFGGTPLAKFKIGGLNLGQASKLGADVLSFLSLMSSNDATMASIHGGHDRRFDDWKLQERMANKELEQLDSQIAAAELRIKLAEQEIDNHALQAEHAKEVDEHLRSKFTNRELYQWMVGQVSQVYFQSYQLAYDLAKRAEKCFRFELGVKDSDYIQFGYWDSLKKGLLSGEKLQFDLRRLETAYLDQNRREYELTKHISLAMSDPLALVQLRETGRCFFSFPEEIFDLDYPGHYFRRIKSVSISLPCVSGPYTTISCTLRQLKNEIRIETGIGGGYEHNNDEGVPTEDTRFVTNNIPVKSIAVSSGQNDSGMFELSFRDERYLPFEGSGVISDWALELFNDLPANNPDPSNPDFGRPLRQFDFSTITDAVIHVKYTAREDAGMFKNAAVTYLRSHFEADGKAPSVRMLSLKHDFPNDWHRFLNPVDPADGNVLEFEITRNLFPYRDSSHTLKINSIVLLARCTEDDPYTAVFSPPLPAPPPDDVDTMVLVRSQEFGSLHFGVRDTDGDGITLDFSGKVNWTLKLESPTGNNLMEDETDDIFLVLGYEWQ